MSNDEDFKRQCLANYLYNGLKTRRILVNSKSKETHITKEYIKSQYLDNPRLKTEFKDDLRNRLNKLKDGKNGRD